MHRIVWAQSWLEFLGELQKCLGEAGVILWVRCLQCVGGGQTNSGQEELKM